MHYVPSGPDSFFHLPRAGGVAYAAQESWVQNETIRVSEYAEYRPSLADEKIIRTTSFSEPHTMKSGTTKVGRFDDLGDAVPSFHG